MVGVNELVGCRWGLCQDAEPGKGIGSLIAGGRGVPEGRAGDAMRAVAAGDEVTVEGCLLAVAPVGDPGVVIVDASNRCRFGLEPDLAAVHKPLRDQVFDHFLLAIDCDAAARQLAEIDPVLLPGEAKLDAVVHQTLLGHPIADAARDQEVRRSRFEHPGADSLLDILSTARLQHDGFNTLTVEEMGEQEPGGAGPDDADLGHPASACSTGCPPGSRWRCFLRLSSASTTRFSMRSSSACSHSDSTDTSRRFIRAGLGIRRPG